MGVEGGSLKNTSFAPQLAPDKLSEAFEHSITWEDDLWRADPVDVPEIHAKARQKFNDLLTTVTSGATVDPRHLAERHVPILEALRAGDGAKAAQAVHDHLMEAAALLFDGIGRDSAV